MALFGTVDRRGTKPASDNAMVVLTWILSLLGGLIGSSLLLCLPLGFLTFYGIYSSNSFDVRKMEFSVILFFPLSCLLLISIGRLFSI